MTSLRQRFTFRDFVRLGDELYNLTGSRVKFYLTTQAVVDALLAEFKAQDGFRALNIAGVPVYATTHLPPNTVQAVPDSHPGTASDFA